MLFSGDRVDRGFYGLF